MIKYNIFYLTLSTNTTSSWLGLPSLNLEFSELCGVPHRCMRARKRGSPVPRPHLRSLTTLGFDPNQEGTCRHVCRYPPMRCKILPHSVKWLPLSTPWIASGRWPREDWPGSRSVIWAGTSMVQDIVNKRSVVARRAYPLTHSLLHGDGCIQTRDREVPLKYNLSPVAG